MFACQYLGTILVSTVSNRADKVSMKFVYQAELLSVLVVSSLACGQARTNSTSRSGSSPLEVKVTNSPLWSDTCLILTLQLTNGSESSILLDGMYEGVKIYSSVIDPTNTLGQGTGQAWMLVYGWTDVVSEPITLAPGASRQLALCIGETFPVKETGKATLRQVRVKGKLRIVAEYEIQAQRIIHRPLGKGKGEYILVPDALNRGTFGEVVLEITVPCPNGTGDTSCLSPPPIFSGEHDVYTIELEPPPAIEIQPPALPIFPIDRPLPPKP
jgi:hypothetical protein